VKFKHKISCLFLPIVFSAIILPISSEASTIERTEITVTGDKVSFGDLKITNVSHVSFGEKAIKKQAMTFYSDTDLVIEIEDLRQSTSPWKLNLKVSPFVNEKNETLKGVSYHVGKGSVTGATEGITGKGFSSEDFKEEHQEFDQVLYSDGTKKGQFIYTVKSNDIWLYLPPKQPQGIFHAEKSWLLVDSI